MASGFIGLSEDDDARMYGLPSGVGHVLLVPAGQVSDPLSTGGIIPTPCGGKGVDAERAEEKFTGDRMCVRCVKWLATDGGRNDLEAARLVKWQARNGEGLASIMGDHTLITLDGVTEVKADGTSGTDADTREVPAPAETRQEKSARVRGDRAAAIERERERLAAQRANRATGATGDVRPMDPADVKAAQDAGLGHAILVRVDSLPPRPAIDRDALVTAERERRERLAAQTAGTCGGTGEAPVPGSRVQRDDHSVSVPDDYPHKHSARCHGEGCGRVIAVTRDGILRRHNAPKGTGPATRDDSAPVTLPGMETVGTTGLTLPEIQAGLDAWYAAGNKPSPEIAGLPDPSVKRAEWSGSAGAGDAGSVIPCEFKGSLASEGDELGELRMNAERTHGKCPECSAYIPLAPSKDDDAPAKLNQHNAGGLATPASKTLKSKIMDTVDHGSVPGDPDGADKRRAAETRCDRSRKVAKGATGGTVKCPDCTRPVELKEVTRKNGNAWQYPTHTVPGDSFRATGGGKVRKVTPRGTGADAGKGARDHGSVDGSAYTGRENMAPVQPSGWMGIAGTGVMSMTVRPGIDSKVAGEFCPLCEERVDIAHRNEDGTRWSRGKRRAHSRKMAGWHASRDAERAAKRERDIQSGARLPKGAHRAARKAASTGSFSEGTIASVGVVEHGGARPATSRPVSKRTPAPGEAEALGKRGKRAGK